MEPVKCVILSNVFLGPKLALLGDCGMNASSRAEPDNDKMTTKSSNRAICVHTYTVGYIPRITCFGLGMLLPVPILGHFVSLYMRSAMTRFEASLESGGRDMDGVVQVKKQVVLFSDDSDRGGRKLGGESIK